MADVVQANPVARGKPFTGKVMGVMLLLALLAGIWFWRTQGVTENPKARAQRRCRW